MMLKFIQSSVKNQQTYGHRRLEAGQVSSEVWDHLQDVNVCAKSPAGSTGEGLLTAPHWGRWTEPLLQEAEPAV